MFLKTSRMVKTRTDANHLCSEGRVTVNGMIGKASRAVAVGDVIAVETVDVIRSIEVLKIPANKQVSKDEARYLARETESKSNEPI
jgi:ribosomal 50S subunit-recycling heat shock protein